MSSHKTMSLQETNGFMAVLFMNSRDSWAIVQGRKKFLAFSKVQKESKTNFNCNITQCSECCVSGVAVNVFIGNTFSPCRDRKEGSIDG